MKRVTKFVLIAPDELHRELHEKYQNKIPKEFSQYKNYKWGTLELPLEPDSRELEELCSFAHANGFHPKLFSSVYYTKKELDNIPYFQMLIDSPLELEGTCARDYGTKYVDACPVCGVGGKRVGDVLVDRKFLKKKKIGYLQPDLFVSENVRQIIEEHGFTGVSFDGEVKDYRGRDMEKFYAMNIHHILPPMSKNTWLNDVDITKGLAPKCEHHTIYLASDMQYEREKLEGALDFNLSTEYVNNDKEQQIVVSARVRRAFKKNKIGFSHFIPIMII